MNTMTTTDKTVARAERRAAAFARAALTVPTNTVTESTEEGRLLSWMPLTRTYRVEVTDRTGRVTSGAWSVPLESQPGRRRTVRFFGWGFSLFTGGQKYSESMCRIRVTN